MANPMPEDTKFRAASNVDTDRDGNVENGPYVDPGSYAEPGDDVERVRAGDDRDDGSLFVAADRFPAPGAIQPGLAQPMGGLTTPIDDRGDRFDEEKPAVR